MHIGTAGWSVSRDHATHFQGDGSHLQRYSSVLHCVEINSSFHRSHRRSTWERWAATTPQHFRFAVKMPKRITHEAKLHNAGALLLAFMDEVSGLNVGDQAKLGPLLVQLPPKLQFDEGVVREFLETLRELHRGPVAVEPRHVSWFTGSADSLRREFEAARVAPDRHRRWLQSLQVTRRCGYTAFHAKSLKRHQRARDGRRPYLAEPGARWLPHL